MEEGNLGDMRPLSEDLRQRVARAREKGEGVGEVAKRFGVSRSSVERFWRQHQKSGHCRPQKIGGYRRSRLEGHDRLLRRWLTAQVDITLREVQQRCQERLGLQIGLNALWHRIDRLGLSYKKNDARRRARTARC
jgi:transposase